MSAIVHSGTIAFKGSSAVSIARGDSAERGGDSGLGASGGGKDGSRRGEARGEGTGAGGCHVARRCCVAQLVYTTIRHHSHRAAAAGAPTRATASGVKSSASTYAVPMASARRSGENVGAAPYVRSRIRKAPGSASSSLASVQSGAPPSSAFAHSSTRRTVGVGSR